MVCPTQTILSVVQFDDANKGHHNSIRFRSSSVMLCTSVDEPSSSWTLPELDMFSLDSVNQMALDWASGNWYFLDDSREMILLCSLKMVETKGDSKEDSNEKFLCKTLVSVRVSKPRGIALDPNAGLMFFSVWGGSNTAKIERAQLV